MSRTIVHPSVVTRTGTSRGVRTQAVRYATAVLPSFVRYASGVQRVVTSYPPN